MKRESHTVNAVPLPVANARCESCGDEAFIVALIDGRRRVLCGDCSLGWAAGQETGE